MSISSSDIVPIGKAARDLTRQHRLSTSDAPEIDGVVYIENGQQLNVGDFVEVKITDSDAHDLWAEIA